LVQLNDHTKKMVQDIRDLCLPDLTTFLSKGGGSGAAGGGVPPPTTDGPKEQNATEFACTICNKFTTKNKRSLTSHISMCSKKQPKQSGEDPAAAASPPTEET
jgi:hypothetical protein